MAKQVLVVDDIDGSANAETIDFSYDGVSYSIDLAKKNRAAFEKALKPYIEAATPDTGGRRRTSSSRSRSRTRSGRQSRGSSPDLAAVRAWAREQGIEVSERGRVARSVIETYDAAH